MANRAVSNLLAGLARRKLEDSLGIEHENRVVEIEPMLRDVGEALPLVSFKQHAA